MANLSNINNKFIVEDSGDVGIGVTTATTKLHIGGTAPGDSIIRQDSTTSGTNWEIGERAAGKWQIFEDDGDSIVATFMSSGNVGIGTTSPGTKLDVNGAGSTGTISWANDGGRKRGYLYSDSAGVAIYSTALNKAGIYMADDVQIDFRVNGAERMRIDSSGNVGITAAASFRFNGAGDNTHATGYDSTIDGSFLRGQLGMRFLTGTGGGTERMRIDSSGRTIIQSGTLTAPAYTPAQGYPLHVQGNSNQSYISIGRAGQTTGSQGMIVGIDTTTSYLWNRDNINITFGCGDLEKLRISPSSQSLRIKGGSVTGSNYMQFVNSAGTAQGYFGYGGASNILYMVQQVDGDMQFYSNGATRMTIKTDGNVGINTASPTSKLEVRRYSGDRTTLSTIISVTNEGSGPYTGFGGKISFNSNIYYGATTPGIIETAYVGAVLGTSYETTSDLVFATRVSATSVTEKMRILGNGNVGIGTTSPRAVGSGYKGLEVSSPSSGSSLWLSGFSDTIKGYLAMDTGGLNLTAISNHSLTFGTNNSPKMTILSGGNVGIGTTSPDNKLEVAGGINYNNKLVERMGGRNGTGTYTLFTNGTGSTQSTGTVEIAAIFQTPSTSAIWKYKISGNRSGPNLIWSETTGYTGSAPTLSWNSATLEVSNSNSSVYYAVVVRLFNIGVPWYPTWGNLPGISN